jgi:hypothetical protein
MGDNNDGAPAEMIAGLGTDGDWDFGDDYRSEDDAPQICGVIATSDPLWMVAPRDIPPGSSRGCPG